MPALPISPALISITLILLIVQPTLIWLSAHSSANKGQLQQKRTTLSISIGVFLFVWLFLALTLGIGGFFDSALSPGLLEPVPNIAFTLLPLLIAVLALMIFPALRLLVRSIPMHWLVLLQTGRIIGLAFLILAGQGLLPKEFATPAGWGDFITGISAPLVAYLYYRQQNGVSRGLVWAWNFFGFGDLILAVTLGTLSTPGPFQHLALDFQYHELVRLGSYPLILIPAFAVPLAQVLHIFAFYKLWHKSRS